MRRCFALLTVLLVAAPTPEAQQTLTAPDGSEVTISRSAYGVPRITAESETAGFYAQGWAAAHDRLFQMETFWRASTGRLSEIQGEAALPTDQAVRTVFYTPAERAAQFDALPLAIRDGLDAYIAGINAYIDLAESDAATYKPFEYTQFPLNAGPIERWDRDKAVAVLQFFMRRFGEVGGNELARLAELEANGQEWFDANRPLNDPEAYTSLQSSTTLGSAPSPEASGAINGGPLDPALVAALRDQREASDAYLRSLGVPLKLGSFAALVRPEASASGDALLLGAPQMGNPQVDQKAVTSEVEIAINGGFHIAGMTVPGIMGVIIGRVGTADNQRAWTLTTGFTDNTDTFVESLNSPVTYIFDGETRAFEIYTEQIRVLGADDVIYPHFRTVHGPVFAEDFANDRVFTYQYAFWDRELEMVEAFYSAWQSTSLADWERVASEIPMSFNIFYADTDQNLAYWHVGRYPERTADPRLPASGVGTEEWTGFVDFADHPQAVNFSQPYLVNWNNKPSADWDQGDNVPWTSTAPGRTRAFDGAQFLDDHLAQAQASGDGITFEEVQELTRVVRSNPRYPEYPGTYQQVLAFADGSVTRAENVIPPGQSGFISASGVPSPHFADQWAFYISSIGDGPVQMKTFGFSAGTATALSPEASGAALGAVYPNPTTGALSVDLSLVSGAEVRVSLVDVLGREVASRTEQRTSGEQPLSLDARGLAAGTYTLRVETGERVQTRRVVIAR